jgi:hypothetical protein
LYFLFGPHPSLGTLGLRTEVVSETVCPNFQKLKSWPETSIAGWQGAGSNGWKCSMRSWMRRH